MNAIGRALKVHEGEGRLVALMVGTTFVASAGIAIGQSGVNALFLERVGADALPATYLLQGATAFVVMLALTGMLGRVERRTAYLAIPAVLAAIVVAERALLVADARWLYVMLWLTVAFALLAQNVGVWGVAGAVTDTRRAKRLFPLFASGDILGSVVGGLLTGRLAQAIGAENLLLVWAGALVATFALCRAVLPVSDATARARRARAVASPLRDLRAALGYVWRSRLLTWMTFAAVLFSVLFFSLFLPWAAAATERYPDANDLAGFFGLFWGVTTGIAFLASILVTNRLFVWLGVTAMLAVLPIIYVGSFAILFASTTFVTLVTLRFVSGVWLQGVASPAWETLTNVVPESRRDQVRAFINGGPAQAGTAIAGVIAMVGQQALSSRQLALIGLVAAAITVAIVVGVRRSYASALVEALRAGRPHVFGDAATPRVPFAFERDAEVLRTVLAAARDADPSVRRLAMTLLAEVDDARARDALEEALGDPDGSVRAEAAAALVQAGGSLDRLRGLVDDPEPLVAATASVALSAREGDHAAAARLRTLARDENASVRAGVLERLRAASPDVVAPIAAEALDDEAPAVRAAAVTALANGAPGRAIDAVVGLFDDPSPRVRRAAAQAAGAIGPNALDPVLEALGRPATREPALAALVGLDLAEREGSIRYFIDTCVEEAVRDLRLANGVGVDDEPAALLRDAVLERARGNGRVALLAMSLLANDGAAIRTAIEHLSSREPAQVATALETLETTADARLLRPLIPLWESSLDAREPRTPDALPKVLEDDDPFIRSCGELVLRARRGGEDVAELRTEMPVMERVLFLRKVSLFDGLGPSELHAIAEVAQDQVFGDGDILAVQGELGDALHIVAAGTVRVETDGSTVARRGPGDVVGELSLVTHDPRIATLAAEGDVRAIRIGRREFEGMVHDRPEIALGVIRVLARRLAEARPHAATPA